VNWKGSMRKVCKALTLEPYFLFSACCALSFLLTCGQGDEENARPMRGQAGDV
jgi:hypothetical protein